MSFLKHQKYTIDSFFRSVSIESLYKEVEEKAVSDRSDQSEQLTIEDHSELNPTFHSQGTSSCLESFYFNTYYIDIFTSLSI